MVKTSAVFDAWKNNAQSAKQKEGSETKEEQ